MTAKQIEYLRMKLGWLYLTAFFNQENIPYQYDSLFKECDIGNTILTFHKILITEDKLTALTQLSESAENILANLVSNGINIIYCVMPTIVGESFSTPSSFIPPHTSIMGENNDASFGH